MKISTHIHQQLRLKNGLITLILLGLIGGMAWLSSQHTLEVDITGNAGNTLALQSQKVLSALPDPVAITAFIPKGQPVRLQIAQLVDRYSRIKPDLTLSFVDPAANPDKAHELNIDAAGAVVIDYQGRSEKLNFIDEAALSNALLHLTNANERWVSFLTGHGERLSDGQANFDFSEFSKEMDRRKIKAQYINLANIPAIPENSALLVIAAPAVALLPGELFLVKTYLDKGGNLLLLTEPDNQAINALLEQLNVQRLSGVIFDNSNTLYGLNDPSFIVASDYAAHPATRGLQTITLFPTATALSLDKNSPFQATDLLKSSAESWTETSANNGKAVFDAVGGDKQGPLTFAYALTRELADKKQQRIVVVGDSDFISNAYLGNVGNLDLGLRIVNWLIHDDRSIDIPPKIAGDKSLQLTHTSVAIIGFGFLLVIPLSLLLTGLMIWRKRKQR
ncbi:MAG: GldG family protein [Methylococcales bacterium]